MSGNNTALVTKKGLGINCWGGARFFTGQRCSRVYSCTYPEKRDCLAVRAELLYLVKHSAELIEDIKSKTETSIQQLTKDLKK